MLRIERKTQERGIGRWSRSFSCPDRLALVVDVVGNSGHHRKTLTDNAR
jgi:hypothetical protein